MRYVFLVSLALVFIPGSAAADTVIPRDPDSVVVCFLEGECEDHDVAQSRVCDADSGSATNETAEVDLDARRIEARVNGGVQLRSANAELVTGFSSPIAFPALIDVGVSYFGELRGGGGTRRGTVRIIVSLVEFDEDFQRIPIGDPQTLLNRTEDGSFGNTVTTILNSQSDAVAGALQSASFAHDLEPGVNYAIVGRLEVEARGLNTFSNFRTGASRVEIGCPLIRPDMEDTDGDGLFDAWETAGLDMGEDGFLDLPALGARVDHKDVFLELDWLQGDEPTAIAIEAMKDAFAAAPIDNPDGETGVTLWVDTGALMESGSPVGDDLGGGAEIETTNILGQPVDISGLTSNFYGVRDDNFAPNRRFVFRYAMSYAGPTNDTGVSTGGNSPTTLNDTNQSWVANEWSGRTLTITGGTNAGDACTIGSNTATQITVSACGAAAAFTTTPDNSSAYAISGTGGQAFGPNFVDYVHDPATVMHELGHTLGLSHGGAGDGRNCKPNYMSVMNYRYQPGGIPVAPGAGTGIDWNGDGVFETIDFSPPRFAGGRAATPLPTLDESALDEDLPQDPSDPAHLFIFIDGANRYASTPINGCIDWDGDMPFDCTDGVVGPVNTNIGGPSGQESQCNAAPNSGIETVASDDEITGNDDWSQLRLNFRLRSSFLRAAEPGTLEITPTLEDYERRLESLQTTDLALSKSFAPGFTAAGQDVALTLTVANNGPNIARGVALSDPLAPEFSAIDLPPGCGVGADNALSCDIGVLAAGESAERTVGLHVAADIDCGDAQIRSIANEATAENTFGPDARPEDNTAAAALRTLCVRYEYVAKFVCGAQPDPRAMRLARGWYASSVNIHNPNDEVVTLFSKLALTHPPAAREPGAVRPIGFNELGYDEAAAVDCDGVRRELFGGEFPEPNIEGFVVVQSPRSLDVTGLYSSAALDGDDEAFGQASTHTEQIRERKRKSPPEETPPGETPTGAADLRAEDARCLPPPPGAGNRSLAARVTVVNDGPDGAPPSELSAAFSAGAPFTASIPALAAGASETVEAPLPRACGPACVIEFRADATELVVETDETNNGATLECLPFPG